MQHGGGREMVQIACKSAYVPNERPLIKKALTILINGAVAIIGIPSMISLMNCLISPMVKTIFV